MCIWYLSGHIWYFPDIAKCTSQIRVGHYGTCEGDIGNLVSLDCGDESWTGSLSVFQSEKSQREERSAYDPQELEGGLCEDKHGEESVCDTTGFTTCTTQCSQTSSINISLVQWCRCDTNAVTKSP